MNDISEETNALARATGRIAGAHADILAVLIGILIRHGVVSDQTIREELFDELRSTMVSTAQSVDVSGDPTDVALRSKLTLQFLDQIEGVLFPESP